MQALKLECGPLMKNITMGHGRAEPIVGLIIVVFLGIVAFEILLEVYKKILLG